MGNVKLLMYFYANLKDYITFLDQETKLSEYCFMLETANPLEMESHVGLLLMSVFIWARDSLSPLENRRGN